MKTEIFERFLDSKYGQQVLERFNKEKKFIENPADLIVRELKNKIRAENYLDVGGGTGVKTSKIMKGIGIARVDFLEPSRKASSNFRKKSGLDINVINSSFEDFETEKQYDLITAIHTWYYINLDALEKLYRILKDGGTACIFMDSKGDTLKKIQKICELEFLGYKSNNAEDVCKYLDKIGIKYTIHKDAKTFSGLVKNGDLTARTKTIMSLVSYSKWSSIQLSAKLAVKKMLIGISKEDKYPSRRWLIVVRK